MSLFIFAAGTTILGIAQFITAPSIPGVFFFPAGMMYMGTYMTVWQAFLLGCMGGALFDGFSPFPFGFYAVSIGVGSALAAAGMRFINERSIGGHGVAACGALGIYAVGSGIYYAAAAGIAHGMLYVSDAVYMFVALGIGIGIHILIKKIWLSKKN